MKKLEVKKDYIDMYNGNVIIIDRIGGFKNRGFNGNNFTCDLFCSNPNEWREATEEEVIEAFERHLIHRYGEDWETMMIKEKHPDLSSAIGINNGLWNVKISKEYDGWNVCNTNGLLYCNGVWVERMEETAELSDWSLSPEVIKEIKAGEKADNRYVLKRDVLTILSVESKFNPDKKLSEYLEQFKLILEVL